MVEFIDDSTGNRVSAVWQQLDEITQARILGAGKVLSVLVPVAKVKALAELTRVPSPALKKNGWHPDSVEARHKEWQRHYGGREDHDYQGVSGYVPAPDYLKAFPEAAKAKKKTSVQEGGAKRARWVDQKGNIYEWDSRHGTVEKYNKHGKHLGEFDPETGRPLVPADKNRKVEQ
ncbi:colicin E3/pyocin S6 family cytotoxin [Endozoicomonas sp. 4G]|uniref:colicin E3/pyocin S6 family cytotoxin n=1 Tax=Endozoicomonas sp. 4G TaxID=2872754 RepID=UPI0020790C07|nr:colicin E3/pyocin S6 family cytotoxin [Endozoicomonas sp. 4G]